MRNIWILNHYAITPDMPGSTRHYDFGQELLKKKYKITIFASSFQHHGERKELKIQKKEKWMHEKINNLNFIWLKTFPYKKNDWRRVLNMFSCVYQAYFIGKKIGKINKDIGRPDIILGSSPQLFILISAYLLAKHYKVKFIAELRDLWPQNLIDINQLKENSVMVKILRRLEKFLYHRADKIIIFTPVAESYITSLGINKNKLCIIPNGVDLSRFDTADYEKQFEPENNTFKIMYTGTLGLFYELDRLLKAAKIIQEKGFMNIKFMFMGSGVKKAELIQQSKKLKLNNVSFMEPVPKRKMPDVLRQADAFFIKRNKIFYGSSNKLMDYMAVAKPIIFAMSPGDTIAKDANCGISVPSGNSEDFAEAIIKLHNMPPDQRKTLGENGRKYVEKHNSISVLVNKLDKMLTELTR